MAFLMKIALLTNDPHCKHCFSHDVIKESYNRRKIYLENGVSVIIKVKRYTL